MEGEGDYEREESGVQSGQLRCDEENRKETVIVLYSSRWSAISLFVLGTLSAYLLVFALLPALEHTLAP